VTPSQENLNKKYTTRRNSQGLIRLVPEPEKVYRQIINRHKTKEANNNLGLESIQDIRRSFVDNSSSSNTQSKMAVS
jgi:hypothetical protein